MPTDVSSLLLEAEKLGEKEINAFIKKRINSNALRFWEALPKMNIKTFAIFAIFARSSFDRFDYKKH